MKKLSVLSEAHLAVALAYLKATGFKVGLIINFSDAVIRCRRVFRPAHWFDNEEMKKRTDVSNSVFLSSNIGYTDVPNDDQDIYAYPKCATRHVIPSAKRVGDLVASSNVEEMPDGRGGLGMTIGTHTIRLLTLELAQSYHRAAVPL